MQRHGCAAADGATSTDGAAFTARGPLAPLGDADERMNVFVLQPRNATAARHVRFTFRPAAAAAWTMCAQVEVYAAPQ